MASNRPGMRLYIDSLNGHRAGDFIATALRIGFMEVCDDITIVYKPETATHAILYATLDNNAQAEANKNLGIPTILLHDDPAVPSVYANMVTIPATAIYFLQCMYYHPLYTNPIISKDKQYDFVYGGTFKFDRLFSYLHSIPNEPTTLLIGSDKGWDKYFSNVTRLDTIKDMYVLYTVMSKCKATYTEVPDNKLPLRAIEPYMCGISKRAPINEQQGKDMILYLHKVLQWT